MARYLLDEFDTLLLSINGIGERQSGQTTIASIPTVVDLFPAAGDQAFQPAPPAHGTRTICNNGYS